MTKLLVFRLHSEYHLTIKQVKNNSEGNVSKELHTNQLQVGKLMKSVRNLLDFFVVLLVMSVILYSVYYDYNWKHQNIIIKKLAVLFLPSIAAFL
jgi:hypothetical protein